MKKFFLIAVVASLFSITAQAAERPANYYRPYGHNTSYTRASESKSSQNYQRQQYRQPSYYPQKVQRQPAPDYRYQQAQYAPYDTFRIRPVIGLDYVYSMADFNDDEDDEDFEDKFNAFALSAGIQLNPYFGLEAFYQQSDKGEKTLYGGKIKTQDEYKAYGLDIIGYLPVASQLDLIGTLGVAYYKAEIRASLRLYGISASDSESEDKIGFRFGGGLQFYLTDYLAFRLMARYNAVNIDGLDNIVDVTAGLRFYF